MKKLALALMAASAAIFGLGVVASAAGYDPAVTFDGAAPAPGGSYTVTYENCFVGDTITFTQADSTPTSVTGECESVNGVVLTSVLGLVAQQGSALGVAAGQFDAAPTEAGVYDGTAVGVRSPSIPFQFEIMAETEPDKPADPTPPATQAPGGMLPETGSNGIGPTTRIALGLLVVGLGMFVVAQLRRRQATV